MKKSSIGLVLSLSLFFAWPLSARSPKIDAEVYDAFDNEIAAFKAALPSPKEAGLRVVIQLNPMGRLRPSDLGKNEDGSLDVLADDVFQAQADFVDGLQQDGILGRRSATGLAAFNVEVMLTYQYALAATVSDTAVLEEIAEREDVVSVVVDNLNQLYTVEGRARTGSTQADLMGFRGDNIGVAVIDSQFDLLHPELGGSTNLPNGVVSAGRNFSDNNPVHSQNFNNCYHGTGTASIVRRYARGSDLYALVVFPNAFDSVIANAIDWCVTNRAGVNGGAPIRIISMSLGGGRFNGTCDSGVVHTAAGTARARGILLLAAAGNDGWGHNMGSPACSSNIISIGSVWDSNDPTYSPFPPAYCKDRHRRVNERACYSNISSALDLYAPSERVDCARCGGGTAPLGGTSSACPAAAGLIAQLMEARPELMGDHHGVLNLLKSTGRTVTNDESRKCIDIAQAVITCAQPASSMTAWWPLGDFTLGSPTVNDRAGTNNRGTRHNGVLSSPGRVGRCNKFDGVNDYISVASHGDVSFGTGDFTITAWIRTNRTSEIIVTKRNSSDTRGYLLMLYNGRLLLQMGDSSGPLNFYSTSTPILSDDAWHHIAVTVDRSASTGGRMYIDGRVVYTFNPTSRRGSLDTSDSLRIGQQDGAGKYFLGYLDELTFYKRAVPASNIAAEFRANDLGKCY